MTDNKETDLYLKNGLMYDTVKIYLDKLDKLKYAISFIFLRMQMMSDKDWSGSGRIAFEEALVKWRESAVTVMDEITCHKNIIDELLTASVDLYEMEKDITEDIE